MISEIMLGHILLAILLTYGSAQGALTSRASQSPYLPDRSSWSSMTGLFSENINDQMSQPHYLQDGGQSSWTSMSDSFSNNGNLGSFSLRNLDSDSIRRDRDLTLQPSGPLQRPNTADLHRFESSSPDRSRFSEQNLMTGNLLTDRIALPSSRPSRRELDKASRSNNLESVARSDSFSFRPYTAETYSFGSSPSDQSSFIETSLTNQNYANGNPITNSNGILTSGGNSYSRDLNSIAQSPSSVSGSQYALDSFNLGSSVSDVSRLLDSSLSGQDTMNGNSWTNRNDMLSMRGLTLPNSESVLERNADLSGISTGRSSSVLDGRFIGQELSGFPGSNPLDASYRERDMNRDLQSTDQQSMPDRGNMASDSMSMLQRRGLPWRTTRDFQRRLGQFALTHGMAGRRSRGRDTRTRNRLNTQRDMSKGQSNDIGNVDLNNDIRDTVMSGSRHNSFRPRALLKLVPRISIQRFEPLPSSNEQSSLSSGRGRRLDLNRISSLRQRSQPSSDIDRTPVRSTPDRTTSSNVRSRKMTTYPLQSDSQTSSRNQGAERRRMSF